MGEESTEITSEIKKVPFLATVVVGILSLAIVILVWPQEYTNGMRTSDENVVFLLSAPTSTIVCLAILVVALLKGAPSKAQYVFYSVIGCVFHLTVWILQVIFLVDLEDNYGFGRGFSIFKRIKNEVVTVMVLAIVCSVLSAVAAGFSLLKSGGGD